MRKKIKLVGGPRDGEIVEFNGDPPLRIKMPHMVGIHDPYDPHSVYRNESFSITMYRLERTRTPTDDGFVERWTYVPE